MEKIVLNLPNGEFMECSLKTIPQKGDMIKLSSNEAMCKVKGRAYSIPENAWFILLEN